MLRIDESQSEPGSFYIYDVGTDGCGPRVGVVLPSNTAAIAHVKAIAAIVNGIDANGRRPLTDAELSAVIALSQANSLMAVAANLSGPVVDYRNTYLKRAHDELVRRGAIP